MAKEAGLTSPGLVGLIYKTHLAKEKWRKEEKEMKSQFVKISGNSPDCDRQQFVKISGNNPDRDRQQPQQRGRDELRLKIRPLFQDSVANDSWNSKQLFVKTSNSGN